MKFPIAYERVIGAIEGGEWDGGGAAKMLVWGLEKIIEVRAVEPKLIFIFGKFVSSQFTILTLFK